MSLTGRPEKPIDWDIVDQLLEAGCSSSEIAPHFHMTAQRIRQRTEEQYGMSFSSYSLEKLEKGNSSLRKVQQDKALSGDNTMLVWLGKNKLKQRDSPLETTVTQVQVDLSKSIMEQLTKAQEKKE